jgi:hypothetical protein
MQQKAISTRGALAVAICAAAMVMIQVTHLKIISLTAPENEEQSRPLLPRAELLKFFSLGYNQLLADLWWLNFIQYYGDTKLRLKDKYAYAYNYLDLITQVDPKFTQPYWFAAFAVGSEQKRPDLAARLIERGVRANPDNWYLPFIAGINQYLFAGNDVAAARYYRMAAKFPQAPNWLGRQAVILEAKVPSLIKQTNIWASIYISSPDPLVKAEAKKKLVSSWVHIYRISPSEKDKERARAELRLLGYDLQP